MPVGRIILKSISDSKKMSLLKTDGSRLLYTWLITHLDVNGCFSGDPQVINGKVFTRLKKSNRTVEGYLEDLEKNNLIIRYNVNGDIFLNVPDFVEKQPSLNPKREGKTNIPIPTQDLLRNNSGITPLKDKLSKDNINISKDKDENKIKYLDFVFLIEEEYKKLIDKLGKDKTQIMIERLNGYIGQIGIKKASKKYVSHYHTILNWVRMEDGKKPKEDWRIT